MSDFHILDSVMLADLVLSRAKITGFYFPFMLINIHGAEELMYSFVTNLANFLKIALNVSSFGRT